MFLQPAIRQIYAAIMRGITNIGRDEHEVGQGIRSNISIQLCQRDNAALTSCSIQTNGVEENKRIVFSKIMMATCEKFGTSGRGVAVDGRVSASAGVNVGDGRATMEGCSVGNTGMGWQAAARKKAMELIQRMFLYMFSPGEFIHSL